MTWDWTPGRKVGPFVFGAELPSASGSALQLMPPSAEDADWQTYRVGDEEARVSVENDRVLYVECVSSLRLGGNELIGATITAVNRCLPQLARLVEAYGDGDERWESEALGLTLWVEAGIVRSATVGPEE